MKKVLLALLIIGAVSCSNNATETKETKDTSIVVSKDTSVIVKDTKVTIDTIK